MLSGVVVPYLVDNGSMVSMLMDSFFEYFSHLQKRDCKCLGLKAANGLDIPYTGYIDVDLVVLGKCMVGRGVFVVRDPSNAALQDR